MTSATETLRAIERRADRAIVQELRLMTQEILTMRSHLSVEDRAHADGLLLKLDHLARCQQVDTLPPPAPAPADPVSCPALPTLAFDTLLALEPSAYLVHYYSHDVGDLEHVELTENLYAAVQRVRDGLAAKPRPVLSVERLPSGEITFMTGDDMVLASIVPTEPHVPDVAPEVADACVAAQRGEVSALHRLFARSGAVAVEPLAA
ncbi:hypothetical protein C1I89_06010 [Achromobacter pulmonis]|uniref:Uncharacterized protein n=1 Tax=Achromobacter pulmonis TaxID=1389932 RepID=A0A2N8KK40_9BURK|nr:hypothetical protein [Achromobacter pulmonis]PND33818.1 hypothetical protein C1I89_06010 [Achromobacter pulmonis]